MSTIELSVIKVPVRILHCYKPVLFSFVYITITLAVSKSYPPMYEVLDSRKNPVIATVCSFSGTFLVVPFVHCCFVYPLYRIRVLFAMKLSQNTVKPLNVEKDISAIQKHQTQSV